MPRLRRLLLLIASVAVPVFAQAPPAKTADELLARAIAGSRRPAEAGRVNMQVERSSEGRSFALVWKPTIHAPAGWIVTLHGSGSWAHDEVGLWRPFAQKRNLGIIALQWWFGGGERIDDYYAPHEIRRELERVMDKAGARAEKTLLHGFSRGSANLYALAAIDSRTPRPLFKNVIANSGGMTADFPPNREIDSGRFGSAPYAGTRWWLYCGTADPNPERDGCPAMRRSQTWLREKGATADLTEDASGNHGGFHRRGQNVERALDWFLGAR